MHKELIEQITRLQNDEAALQTFLAQHGFPPDRYIAELVDFPVEKLAQIEAVPFPNAPAEAGMTSFYIVNKAKFLEIIQEPGFINTERIFNGQPKGEIDITAPISYTAGVDIDFPSILSQLNEYAEDGDFVYGKDEQVHDDEMSDNDAPIDPVFLKAINEGIHFDPFSQLIRPSFERNKDKLIYPLEEGLALYSRLIEITSQMSIQQQHKQELSEDDGAIEEANQDELEAIIEEEQTINPYEALEDSFNDNEAHDDEPSFQSLAAPDMVYFTRDMPIPFLENEFRIDRALVQGSNHTIPMLVLRGMVLMPNTMRPIMVARKESLAILEAMRDVPFHRIACFTQREDEQDEYPTSEDDIFPLGVLAEIANIVPFPNEKDSFLVMLELKDRITLDSIQPGTKFPMAHVAIYRDIYPTTDAQIKHFQVLRNEIKKRLKDLGPEVREQMVVPGVVVDNTASIPDEAPLHILIQDIAHSINETLIPREAKLEMLTITSVVERFEHFLHHIKYISEIQHLKHGIDDRTKAQLDEQQREYFLQQQMRLIQEELGEESNPDVKKLLDLETENPLPEKAKEVFDREIQKMLRMNQQSPDYGIQMNYLEAIVNLPWSKHTKDNTNLAKAKRTLDRDHFGLEEVKQRILEHLAVLKLRDNMESPIICLYGPPGVGKTSLGRSIADALNRKYVRIALGGLHDESEIRGHRRTYIGAMPGRIVKSLTKAQANNPVFILDEIDKVKDNGVQGDPYAALLEVLDPEQNNSFHDNYIDMDYDLSKVLFIATANDIGNIPEPLKDRMEMIDISGYITEEKYQIAKRHLFPRALKATGLENTDIKLPKATIIAIIDQYTRESGVRQLERQIQKVLRKLAFEFALNDKIEHQTVQPEHLIDLLGVPTNSHDIYQGNKYAGVVTGLAWTAVGGEILFVETSLSKGKGGLTITGNLGNVMKESATLAYEYVKSHVDKLGIDQEILENWKIHLHCPEGAIPKDGPSAGITMVTAIVSVLRQCKVKAFLAMTGEITLRGKVLPVGGIREKILAARRSGIKEIILCKENRHHVEEINQDYLKGLTFHYVEDVCEVIDIALTKESVHDAKQLTNN